MNAEPTKHREHTQDEGRVFVACRRTWKEGTVSKNSTLLRKVWNLSGKLTLVHVGKALRDGHIPEHAQCPQEVIVQEKKITECP